MQRVLFYFDFFVLNFFLLRHSSGPLLETLMEEMRSELDNNPPLPGSYTPKKGDLCAATFTDGEW